MVDESADGANGPLLQSPSTIGPEPKPVKVGKPPHRPTMTFPGTLDRSSIPEEIRAFMQPPERDDELYRLDGYGIRSMLGRGGMGVVLAGWDVTLHRPVAIKLMKPSIVSCVDSRERFLREARTLANLTHDNIVPIYQVHVPSESYRTPYLVMPLLAGQTLEGYLLQKVKLSATELEQIALETARGLIFAHRNDIIHRDMKPANIWLETLPQDLEEPNSRAFRVRILDFGLARNEQSHSVTETGAFLGTAAYASPEQIDGQKLDCRTDLYSLGVLHYEAASGVKPFQRSTILATMRAVCDVDPVPLRQLRPDLPRNLLNLVEQLMQKSADSRPDTAKAVQRLLIGNGSEIIDPVVPRRQLVNQIASLWIFAGLAIVLLITLGLALFIW